MNHVTVDADRSDDVLTLYVAGDLSAGSVNAFVDEAAAAIAGHAGVVEIDLAAVTLIDTSGANALTRILDRVNEQGGSMRVSRPRRSARRALNASGLTKIVPVGPLYEPTVS